MKKLQDSKLFVLKSIFTVRGFLFVLIFLYGKCSLQAQNVAPPPASADTLRVIQIIQGQRLRERIIDSTNNLQTIAGNVILKEGLTLFYCDSAVINRNTNILEAFGNIHINQNDSIHTYAQSLRYIG